MRLLSIACFALALSGCAGVSNDDPDSELTPVESSEMEDLEPEGPFDATLENEPYE